MIILSLCCAGCDASVSVPFVHHAHAALIRKASSQGWGIVNNGDHNLCPSCIARAEQETEDEINRKLSSPV